MQLNVCPPPPPGLPPSNSPSYDLFHRLTVNLLTTSLSSLYKKYSMSMVPSSEQTKKYCVLVWCLVWSVSIFSLQNYKSQTKNNEFLLLLLLQLRLDFCCFPFFS